MLGYSEDTLEKVGISDACLGCESTDVNRIENNCVKGAPNQIGEKLSQIN